MAYTRREFLTAGLAATVAAAGLGSVGVGSAAAEQAPAVREIRIPTRVGVFGALDAGPPTGPKVLLLHGFPEFAPEWSAQLDALAAAGFHAVAPDQRGYSPGVRPAGVPSYHLDHPVRDVVAMADALDWPGFSVVGHDWGACVAWLAAARHPSRIESLTAISVPHPAAFAEALRTDPAQQQGSRYMDGFRRPSPIPEDEIRASTRPPTLAGVDPARVRSYFDRLTGEPGALTAALDWYRANDFTGFERDRVGVPTLFVSGDDPLVAASGVAAAARWVDGPYRHRHLTGVGHNIPESAPAAVNALLLEHLRSG